MKTTGIIEETRKRIEDILAAREKELTLLDALIKTEEEEITGANHAMAEATAANSIEEYRMAKAHRESAKDAREMHEARRDALRNKPLISSADYEKTVSAIVSAVAGVESDTKKTLCGLSDEMAAAAADLEAVARNANDILQRLQHEVYRDADRSRNPKTGELMPIDYERKQVNPYTTINWGRQGVKCAQYESYTTDRSRG